MRSLILIPALLVAACASVGETMAEKPPSAVYQTAKSPIEYRDCIIDRASAQAYQITDRDGGYLFALTAGAGQVFSAVPNGTGSTITVWGLLGTRRDARACLA